MIKNKASFSLPAPTIGAIDQLAKRFSGGNVSLVVDVALRYFTRLKEQEIARQIARGQAERTIGTRDAWMRSFWQWMASLFETSDCIDNSYGTRTYGGYMIVFLLKSTTEYPQESDGFDIHVTPSNNLINSDRYTWPLPREASPVDAAEAVSRWIREHKYDVA